VARGYGDAAGSVETEHHRPWADFSGARSGDRRHPDGRIKESPMTIQHERLVSIIEFAQQSARLSAKPAAKIAHAALAMVP
jgi:hypothetical protein